MQCERCGKESDELLDYCAECGRNLCPACMQKGCCGNFPTKSGMEEDNGDTEEPIID